MLPAQEQHSESYLELPVTQYPAQPVVSYMSHTVSTVTAATAVLFSLHLLPCMRSIWTTVAAATVSGDSQAAKCACIVLYHTRVCHWCKGRFVVADRVSASLFLLDPALGTYSVYQGPYSQ